jgi:SAM-dependent methyltransferase
MDNILSGIERYYSDKISLFGVDPRGVDWNGVTSQELRFEQLEKLIGGEDHFSICDIGCGYGAFASYLKSRGKTFNYEGIDISHAMIHEAKKLYAEHKDIAFSVSDTPTVIHDYCVASGIFNVRTSIEEEKWKNHILNTIGMMDKFSRKGFSFNCLTSYSDKDKMKDYLFYGDPCEFFAECKTKYSRNVSLIHDYGLYEFTMLVRK